MQSVRSLPLHILSYWVLVVLPYNIIDIRFVAAKHPLGYNKLSQTKVVKSDLWQFSAFNCRAAVPPHRWVSEVKPHYSSSDLLSPPQWGGSVWEGCSFPSRLSNIYLLESQEQKFRPTSCIHIYTLGAFWIKCRDRNAIIWRLWDAVPIITFVWFTGKLSELRLIRAPCMCPSLTGKCCQSVKALCKLIKRAKTHKRTSFLGISKDYFLSFFILVPLAGFSSLLKGF